MPITHPITEAVMRNHMCRAVADVFKTMLGRQAAFVKSAREEGPTPCSPLRVTQEGPRPYVVGTVGFVGDINGLIYLYFDLDFARLSTCHLLGMTESELDKEGNEVVNDAIGELTNMTVGSFKNGLCDAGYPCKLTIPSILRGTNFCVTPISSSERQIYYFDCAGHRVVTDILLQIGD